MTGTRSRSAGRPRRDGRRFPTAALGVAAATAALFLAPGPASGQAPPGADTAAVPFDLGDPSPNPFREAVRIPFRLGPAERADGEVVRHPDRPRLPDSVRVSVAVYNVLYQRVAWARTPAEGGSVPIRDRRYAVPGRHEAVWRGRNRGGRRVPAGPYFVELVVEGRKAVRRVLLTR